MTGSHNGRKLMCRLPTRYLMTISLYKGCRVDSWMHSKESFLRYIMRSKYLSKVAGTSSALWQILVTQFRSWHSWKTIKKYNQCSRYIIIITMQIIWNIVKWVAYNNLSIAIEFQIRYRMRFLSRRSRSKSSMWRRQQGNLLNQIY